MNKKYDIVLMGATSFVGAITAKRFADMLNQGMALNIALAGRSAVKLDALLKELKTDYPQAQFSIEVADAHEESALATLAQSSRVIISTVGPYELYGEPLVKACVEAGTHYCDLTGEPQFVHRMLANYESRAQETGACIVHCSGFDSIPSDLGVYFLQQQSQKLFQAPCEQVDMRVKAMKGTFSGGTIASMMTIIQQIKDDPSLKKILFNPYALSPTNLKVSQKFVGKPVKDWVSEHWLAPFLMASINTKVVFRSAQQLPELYPENFKYNEAMFAGKGFTGWRQAQSIAIGLGVITVGSAFSVTRRLLGRFLPKPGEGPSVKDQENGFYIIHHYGQTAKDQKVAVKFTGDQDPGYGSTSKMLAQVGLALLEDLPVNQAGGFWTPASLLGDSLLQRLPAHAGISIEVLPATS